MRTSLKKLIEKQSQVLELYEHYFQIKRFTLSWITLETPINEMQVFAVITSF